MAGVRFDDKVKVMMESNNRRHFLKLAGATAVGSVLAGKEARAEGKPMRLGVVVWVRKGETPDAVVARVKKLGFPTCQIGFNELTKESAGPLKRALKRYKIEATALLELGPGRMVWDFYEGPLTIGLVPKATRRARIKALELAADVASECGIPAIHTHCGFIPMNPNNPVYGEVVVAVREIAIHCKKKGRMLWCETGQETPITLVRLIQDVGTGNLGINLDVANLILYDTGNPVDALEIGRASCRERV